MSITMIGLDTAKSVFQVHAVNEAGEVVVRRKLQRSELIAFFEKQASCTVVMEACGAAHHWARALTGLGHEVKLIAPEAVRPFVKRGKKNDAADAAAICEAAFRPGMRFVPIKSLEQQGVLALHSARSLLVKQQTMLANAIRGLATEFGLTVGLGMGKLGELLALVDADEAVPEKARQALNALFDQCRALDESTEAFEAEIVAHARHDDTARRLATIPCMDFVLVPGFMTDGRLWRALEDDLHAIGPVTHADLTQDGSIAGYADRLLSAAPDRFLLIGFSMGGYVAREVVRRASGRVAALVLIATSSRAEGPKPGGGPAPALPFRGLSRRAVMSSLHLDRAGDDKMVSEVLAMGQRLGGEVLMRQSSIRRDSDPGLLKGDHMPDAGGRSARGPVAVNRRGLGTARSDQWFCPGDYRGIGTHYADGGSRGIRAGGPLLVGYPVADAPERKHSSNALAGWRSTAPSTSFACERQEYPVARSRPSRA